jgi:methyltransferase-like protein
MKTIQEKAEELETNSCELLSIIEADLEETLRTASPYRTQILKGAKENLATAVAMAGRVRDQAERLNDICEKIQTAVQEIATTYEDLKASETAIHSDKAQN